MCKKKPKLKWTQAETGLRNNALIDQARARWVTAVDRYNKRLPNYDKMWGHKVARIQDLSDVDWKDTKLGTLERMLGKAETREGELAAARGYTWDDSGAPNRADYGSISLYDRTGARNWDTNIFLVTQEIQPSVGKAQMSMRRQMLVLGFLNMTQK